MLGPAQSQLVVVFVVVVVVVVFVVVAVVVVVVFVLVVVVMVISPILVQFWDSFCKYIFDPPKFIQKSLTHL